MDKILAMMDATQTQSAQHIRDQIAAQRRQGVENARFKLRMQEMQESRASENTTRKQMNDILSDMMTVLKKNGDQIRQSGS